MLLIGGVVALLALICVVGGGALAYNQLFSGGFGRDDGSTTPTEPSATQISAILPAAITEEGVATPPPTQMEVKQTEAPPTPTSEPTFTPTVTMEPTATVPIGIPFSRINSISIEGSTYVVDYETFEFTEKISSVDLHVHFFFDTVPPEQAGVPGGGPWKLYGGPRPFTGYLVTDRPASATQMCILVANPDHSVHADSGNCVELPDVMPEGSADNSTLEDSTAESASVITPVTLIDDHGSEMVLIPRGSFEMGSDDGEPDAMPVHTVNLEDYYIDKYEITNAQYIQCVDAGACNPHYNVGSLTREDYYGNPEFDNYPVIYVTWYDGVNYCKWRDGARLPTPAEWEKAGRGTDNRLFPWGNEFIFNCDYLNFNNCVGDTAEVGSYAYDQSPYGVFDLAGNIREWTSDYYRPYPGGDPNGSPNYGKGHRELRGGAFDLADWQVRLTNRASWFPSEANSTRAGFRCARTP
jgi:formylglycine-generating enzyme required for sulfatase activity